MSWRVQRMNYYYTISLRVQKGGHQEVSEEAKTVMLAATVKSPKGTFRTFWGFFALQCQHDDASLQGAKEEFCNMNMNKDSVTQTYVLT